MIIVNFVADATNWTKEVKQQQQQQQQAEIHIYLQNLFTYNNTGLTHSVSMSPIIPLLFSTLQHFATNIVKTQKKGNINIELSRTIFASLDVHFYSSVSF